VLPIASADRRDPRSTSLVGLTTNEVPVAIDLSGRPTLRDVVARADRAVGDGLRDQVPIALLRGALRDRGVDPDPIVANGNLMLEGWQAPPMPLGAGVLELDADRPNASLHGTAMADLAWAFRIGSDGELTGGVIARAAALAPGARADLARWLARTLHDFGRSPDLPLGELTPWRRSR
jgi:hypothetical protein